MFLIWNRLYEGDFTSGGGKKDYTVQPAMNTTSITRLSV